MIDFEAKLAAAMTEYGKWGTGFDSRRPEGACAWVGREDHPGQWTEVQAYPGSFTADNALHEHAMRAALKAALAVEG
ncbi:hypothetical protein HNR01_001803 [Methylorubrum rhodesianum]|uniref:hypothetical protein n=1 Tax=Methylorubrum rhodesianum TaxID=29427 RepID=UPI001607BC26|nr:hypothetical protein [Methylorubrum rhodesianum]MBB5762183.1 hypothetical protein [Methylorubrum rhodesianum]